MEFNCEDHKISEILNFKKHGNKKGVDAKSDQRLCYSLTRGVQYVMKTHS